MNENASPPPSYPQVVAEEGETDGEGDREEERLHLAEILNHQVGEMIVNSLRVHRVSMNSMNLSGMCVE